MALTNAELRAAFCEVMSAEFEHIPMDESSIEFTFSPRFLKRMEKLFRAQKKAYWKFVNTGAKRVAIGFLAATMLFATACSFKAVREPIVRFITEIYETFASYFAEGETVDKIEKEYVLDPIPEGFVVTNIVKNDNMIVKEYVHQNSANIVISQMATEKVELILDTEREGTYTETIDGLEVMIYDTGKTKIVMCIKGGYYFEIVGTGEVSIAVLKQIIVDLK